ncbi:ATP-binding protein [Polymorphospora rubra]
MSLQIDTSSPLLLPSQLVELVRAVEGADEHDEHRWIEWKSSGLDPATAAGQAHIVKQIIGLANRQPTAAAQSAGGYGYLLVGVEPGEITGVTTVDPATLIGKVRSCIGDAVQWRPEYVQVDGKTVLIVIVDPPKPGDPICYTRKHIDKFQAGTIYVRHAGRTDQATPNDLDMLQARLLERTPSLQMSVAAIPATIEEVPDIRGAVDEWVVRRRPALAAARYRPASRRPGASSVDTTLGALIQTVQDTRTQEQYAAEVEQFLDETRPVLVDRGIWDLYRHEPASLVLTVRNPTDLGYAAVRLVVKVPGKVMSYPEELDNTLDGDRPDLPTAPKPLGTPTTRSLFPQLNRSYDLASRMPALHLPGPGPSYTVRDTESVTIEYDEFELRPHDEMTLEPVPLLVHEAPGATLTATWSATAAQVRGRLTGEFIVTVGASTLRLDNLDEDLEEDE